MAQFIRTLRAFPHAQPGAALPYLVNSHLLAGFTSSGSFVRNGFELRAQGGAVLPARFLLKHHPGFQICAGLMAVAATSAVVPVILSHGRWHEPAAGQRQQCLGLKASLTLNREIHAGWLWACLKSQVRHVRLRSGVSQQKT